MQNPYEPPSASETNKVPEQLPPSRFSKWASGITIGLSILLIIAFCISAGRLIPQAMRLEDDALLFPPQFRNSNDSAVRASWILGISSIVLAVASVIGIVFSLRKRLLTAWVILAFCIAVFVMVAIVFSPT